MPALPDDVFNAMEHHLEKKFENMKRLIPFQMTHEECISLVAPREHIPILMQASKLAAISAAEGWFSVQVPAYVDGESGCLVQFYMRTHSQKQPPLRPRVAAWQAGLAGQDSFVAGEKAIAWLDARFKLGRRFGATKATLRYLYHHCDTGVQLRYLMPAVMQLVKRHPNFSSTQNDRVDRWGEKHATYKAVRSHPAVSPQLKGYIQDASALLTSTMLIGEVPEPEQGEVLIAECGVPNFWWGAKDTGYEQPRM